MFYADGTTTGNADIDRVARAHKQGDIAGLISAIRFESLLCSTQSTIDGKPGCLQGEANGTNVTVISAAICPVGGYYRRELVETVLRHLVPRYDLLFAAYAVREGLARGFPPATRFLLVFGTPFETNILIYPLDSGGRILRIAGACFWDEQEVSQYADPILPVLPPRSN